MIKWEKKKIKKKMVKMLKSKKKVQAEKEEDEDTEAEKGKKNNSIKRLLSVIQFFLYQQEYSKPILCLLLFSI
nr:hypothetical protein [Mycoplasmopsis bovis]